MDVSDLDALFDDHPTELARALLGCELTVTTAEGSVRARLTEVEAYGDQGEDPGAHSYNGKTARNASLFGPPRHLYLYLSYGIHHCANLVGNGNRAGGVLLRAGEVIAGRSLAITRRGGQDTGSKLLSGPGRFAQGMGLTLSMDGQGLQIGEAGDPSVDTVRLVAPREPVDALLISKGPRVGVSGKGGSVRFPWRYWLEGNPSVSRYRPGRGVRRQ
ncbi:DNA-3-methyladenine glycosylase [Nesterenkonia cremea]|uniref:DNA-3-methyladenine glycosylase n=1 Tax=Nesterenkonia cremea TaxID=1882340 RepID=UPI0016646C9D|nr:DNA-3-methyladenine glycosylase [Nesterenkonia cremea]